MCAPPWLGHARRCARPPPPTTQHPRQHAHSHTRRAQGFLAYWKAGYDWRQWEAKLNELRQFKSAPIEGVELHFIHEPAPDARATPLLLLHGWPGSIFEFYKARGRASAPPAGAAAP